MKKIVSFLIALGMLGTASIPTFAEDLTISYDSSVDSSPSSIQTCEVGVEKAEVYTVTLPKYVQLDGSLESPTQTYEVSVSGEISQNKNVRVIPRSGYISIENGDMASKIDLNVVQEVIKWNSTDVFAGATTTGTITVESLDPGKYVGQVEFFVSLDDGYFYAEATCTTPLRKIAYDTNDNGVQDTDELLETPISVGSPLGHAYEGEHQFEYTCTRCRQTIYEVSTPEEWVTFAGAVNSGNSFANKTVSLSADIDFYELTATSTLAYVGAPNVPFSGTFDGNGHSISGIQKMSGYVAGSSTERYVGSGLFGYVSGATIKNLIYRDCNMTITTPTHGGAGLYYAYHGGFVGTLANGVTFEKCRIYNVQTTLVTPAEKTVVLCAGPFVGGNMLKNTGYFVTLNDCSSVDFIVTGNSGKYEMRARGYKYGCYQNASTDVNINVNNSYVLMAVSYISTDGDSYTAQGDCTGATLTTNNVPTDLTDTYLQSAEAVDLLNTGYTTPVWKLDLLNENNGYPIQIMN